MSRAALRTALLRDLPTAVETMVSTIREQIPAYAALSAEQVAEVSAIASWGLQRILDLWVADQELSPADLRRFEGIGAVRALDGRPLPGVLRAYRLAGRSITERITRTAGDDLTVADAMALANLWMAAIDSLSEALYSGHAQATDRVAEDRENALADLLVDLLHGRQVTLTALADRSRQLSISLPARPAVVVLRPANRLHQLLSSAGLADDESVLRSTPDARGVVLCRTADVPAVAESAHASGVLGCAVQALRANDVNRAYRLADLCLDRAPRHAYNNRAVLDEGDAQIVALLSANPLADPAKAAECILRDVVEPANAHILEGLDSFLAHGSATTAAHELDLHAQTMRYRLRRLRELTGRDPRRPWDRFVLEAARGAVAPVPITRR